MPRKLPNNKKRVNKLTWCMVYTDDLRLLAFISYNNQSIGTKNNYFDGTKKAIRKEARDLGLDFSEWNDQMEDAKDKI